MEFEEFFKKKKIDMVTLETSQPALFSEFKAHYEQMGEKSFDHSKKYWFNKLRRQFPLAPGPKVEKVIIENQVAEQTITESLTETVTPAPSPKLGFVPKFKAANMAKPAAGLDDKKEDVSNPAAAENASPDQPAGSTETKPAYKPRFKMPSKPGKGE